MAKSINREFYKKLKPIKRRVMLKHTLKWSFAGIIIGLCQAVIWLILSFIFPIMNIEIKMAISAAAVICSSFILSFIIRPSLPEMVKEGDKRGLNERLITAYELSEKDDIFARLQREDAVKALTDFDYKSIKIFNFNKKQIYIVAALCIMLVAGMFIPNPQNDIVNTKIAVKKEIENQIKKVEKETKQNLEKETELTKLQKEEVKKLLKELSENLRKTKDYKEALKEISKTENEFVKKITKANENKMASLGSEMMKHSPTQALGTQISKMNSEQIQKQLEKMKEDLEKNKLSKEDMKKLQEALEKIKKNLPDNELKSQLGSLASALAADLANGTNLSLSQISNLQGMLSQMAGNLNTNPADIRYLLQQMKVQVANAAGQTGFQFAGAGSGNGQCSCSGSGNGAGSGSGVGTGHTNQDSGSGSSSQTSSSKSAGKGNPYSFGEYEKIYDPTRLGDGGNASAVKGAAGEGASEQVNIGQGIGSFDGFIPYNEVFGDYKNEAVKSIDRNNIPENMQEIVKDYFISLDE